MIATKNAIREDVQWFAGGITWADIDYDERKGEVLRPISQDKTGLPWGADMAEQQREMLAAAFFLNKLTLPPAEGDMTATEVRERIQEYIRSAIPLFEPMETQYNAPLREHVQPAAACWRVRCAAGHPARAARPGGTLPVRVAVA